MQLISTSIFYLKCFVFTVTRNIKIQLISTLIFYLKYFAFTVNKNIKIIVKKLRKLGTPFPGISDADFKRVIVLKVLFYHPFLKSVQMSIGQNK